MGMLERLTLGQEERPWPQSLIEKEELEKWQKYFCDLSNVFLCAVDEKGVPLTELGGSPEEACQVERLIDGEQFQSMLGRVAESELEDRAVERTAYPNFRLAVATSKLEGKPLVNWLICGVMEESEDPGEYENPPLEGFTSTLSEKQFLRVVDGLKSVTDTLVADKLLLSRTERGREKKARLEQEAEEKLKRSELLRDMMWLLGSQKAPREAACDLLKKAGGYLGLDIAAVYRRIQGQRPQMAVKWSKKEKIWEFESDPAISWPPILTAERNLILSSNTVLGEEEKEQLESLELRALMIMPLKQSQEQELWVCFGVAEGERIWELEEIRFLGETVRILQSILAELGMKEPPKRRNPSGANKRKKK